MARSIVYGLLTAATSRRLPLMVPAVLWGTLSSISLGQSLASPRMNRSQPAAYQAMVQRSAGSIGNYPTVPIVIPHGQGPTTHVNSMAGWVPSTNHRSMAPGATTIPVGGVPTQPLLQPQRWMAQWNASTNRWNAPRPLFASTLFPSKNHPSLALRPMTRYADTRVASPPMTAAPQMAARQGAFRDATQQGIRATDIR